MKRHLQMLRLPFLASLIWVSLSMNAVWAHDWLEECDINFSNQFALANVYDQARATFAVGTELSSTGSLDTCNIGTDSPCWVYRQRCGVPGYVNVIPISFPHFHLSFTDPSLQCFVNGGFGRYINNVCVAPDWTREPRALNPHDPSIWSKMWLADRVTAQPRIFDVATIRVGGTEPIQFWFQKTDGTWWFWGNLGPGYWDLSPYAFDVMQVYIRGSDQAKSTPTIQSIVVRA